MRFLRTSSLVLLSLSFLSGCGGGSTSGGGGSGSFGGLSGGGPVVQPQGSGGSPSCQGSRVWGPFDGDPGFDSYVSEAAGSDTRSCIIYWQVDTARNCRNALTLDGSVSVAVTVESNGSLSWVSPSQSFSLSPATIGVNTLDIIPQCSESTQPPVTQPPVIPPSTGGAAPSCSGNRIWGPYVGVSPFDSGSGRAVYIAEAQGRDADNCLIYWEYSASENCSSLFGLNNTGSSATVQSDGSLRFEARGQTATLPVAGISQTLLNQIPDCTNAGGTTQPPVTPQPPVVPPTSSGTQPSCQGNRVWGGSSVGDGLLAYIAEPAGLSSPSCMVIWVYSPSLNCADSIPLDNTFTGTVQADGSLRFASGAESEVLPVGNVSLTTLTLLPSCS